MLGPDVITILAVSYDATTRSLMTASVEPFGARAIPCPTFLEAQKQAAQRGCQGVLIDLAAIGKAQDEEKCAATALIGNYPVLRLRCLGKILIPMIMAGAPRQDKSIADFITKTLASQRTPVDVDHTFSPCCEAMRATSTPG